MVTIDTIMGSRTVVHKFHSKSIVALSATDRKLGKVTELVNDKDFDYIG